MKTGRTWGTKIYIVIALASLFCRQALAAAPPQKQQETTAPVTAATTTAAPKPTTITGNGTVNKIPLWTGSTTIGDSALSQSGGNVTTSGGITASSFTGDGTNLSGVNAATLGGNSAGSFAQLTVSNTFTNSNSFQQDVTIREQAGTILHELGHNFSLGHASANNAYVKEKDGFDPNTFTYTPRLEAGWVKPDATQLPGFQIDSLGVMKIRADNRSYIVTLSSVILPGTCDTDLLEAYSGAQPLDPVSLGLPGALVGNGLAISGFVSSPDTVTLRACNIGTNVINPAPNQLVKILVMVSNLTP